MSILQEVWILNTVFSCLILNHYVIITKCTCMKVKAVSHVLHKKNLINSCQDNYTYKLKKL